MNRTAKIAALLLLPFCVVIAAGQEPVRTLGGKRIWSDATGKFKVEAEFVRLVSGKVQLRRAADGKVITLALDKLAETDQEIARALGKSQDSIAADRARAKAEAIPRLPELKPPAAAPPPQPAAVASAAGSSLKVITTPEALTLLRPQVKDAPVLKLTEIEFAAIRPDPSRFQPLKLQPTLQMPNLPADQSDELYAVLPDEANGLIWWSAKRRGSDECWLERLHVATGKTLEPVALPNGHRLAAIDPSGKFLVTRLSQMRGAEQVSTDWSGVAIWRIDKNSLTLLNRLTPFTNVVMQTYLANGGIAVWQSYEGVLLWNIAEARQIALVPVAPPKSNELGAARSTPAAAISPGGNQIAIASEDGLFIVDAVTTQVLTRISIPDVSDENIFKLMTFSDDGTRVALLGKDLWIINLADGSCIKHVSGMKLPTAGGRGTDALSFRSHNTILFHNNLLFDYEREYMLCKLDHSGVALGSARNLQISVHSQNVGAGRKLVAENFPSDAIMQSAAKASSELYAHTKPGTTVTVSVQVDLPAAEVAEIRTNLEERCRKNGWKLVAAGEQSEYTVAAKSGVGKKEVVTYRVPGEELQTFEVQNLHGGVSIISNATKEMVWHEGMPFIAPRYVELKPGERIEVKAQPKVKPWVFLNANFPAKIFKFPNNSSLLSGKYSAEGISLYRGQ